MNIRDLLSFGDSYGDSNSSDGERARSMRFHGISSPGSRSRRAGLRRSRWARASLHSSAFENTGGRRFALLKRWARASLQMIPALDHRRKLVVFGIRGTHTIYDIITDIVSSSDGEVTFEGYSTHFGTAEAARWFLNHELQTIRRCLDKYEGYNLRLVGHSLGGAIASLMAIMLRKMPREELGFDAEIISAVGYATPPCVSRELAENCSEFVTTMDDIIPRLSTASLARLRDEILQTDWTSVIEKEEWKSVLDLVTNAKLVVSSVQDAARKVSEYAKFGNKNDFPELPSSKNNHSDSLSTECETKDVAKLPEELYVPGAVYYLLLLNKALWILNMSV
ncbi:hypothetical protein Bca52824_017272 [Brassica carinata]|uniref:Fungal lipase-type domain-containing protein n=1 Tax=Brassica carinata TaxID=52824 RepID=A0A8X7VMT5_BRACI|nr:hypothetical protein Bca52824_017272 [Brassica carinata]